MAILRSTFLEYGKLAPKNSSFKGIIDTDSIFGDHGLKEYLARKEAIINSGDDKFKYSFFDYTQRSKAIKQSSIEKIYHTISNDGFLTEEVSKKWLKKARKAFSKKGNLLFLEVLSFESYEEAKLYGLETQSDYACLINSFMPKVAKEMNIDPNNLLWWGDFHSNTAHPHIHFEFFEKKQTITKGKIKKDKFTKIKKIIYTELYNRSKIKNKKPLLEYKKEIDFQTQEISKNIKNNLQKLSYETTNRILNFYVSLKNRGRLQFNSIHQKEHRKELLEIAEMVINDLTDQDKLKKFQVLLEENDKVLNDITKEKIFNNRKTNFEKLKIKVANILLQAYKNNGGKTLKESKKEKNSDLKDDYFVTKLKTKAKNYRRRKLRIKNVGGETPPEKTKRKIIKIPTFKLNKIENIRFSKRLSSKIDFEVKKEINNYLHQTELDINQYLRNGNELHLNDFEIEKYIK